MSKPSGKKKGKRRQKRRKRDLGGFFFRVTQVAMVCILVGVCWLFYQTGYLQTVLSLRKEAQAVMEQSSIEDFQADQSGEVYDADGNLIALLKNDKRISPGKSMMRTEI